MEEGNVYAGLLEECIEVEDSNFLRTLAAVNSAIPGNNAIYLENIFRGVPKDPIFLQRRILELFKETGDVQYLEAYNEIAIRAKRVNEEGGHFPISETYHLFEEALGVAGLTLGCLSRLRDTISCVYGTEERLVYTK